MIDTKIYFLVSILFYKKKSNKLNYYQVRHDGKNDGYDPVSLTIKGEEFSPNTRFMKCNNNNNNNIVI